MVLLEVRRFGNVDESEARYVLGVMRECYERLQPHEVEMVDVLLFEKPSQMEGYMAREREEFRAHSYGVESGFIAAHDAWRGIPRVLVCVERLRGLEEPAREGVLRHEVAHTVLHGSPSYYIFPLPECLRMLGEGRGIDKPRLYGMLHLISIAVKDFEATKLLKDRGYVEDQLAYVAHVLRTSGEDVLAWRLSVGDAVGRLACVLGRLKELCCAAPLLEERYPVSREVGEQLSYLPDELRSRMLNLASRLNLLKGEDTHSRVESLCEMVVKELWPLIIEGF